MKMCMHCSGVLCQPINQHDECHMKKCVFCGDNAVAHMTYCKAANMLAGLTDVVYSYVSLPGFLIVLPYLVFTTFYFAAYSYCPPLGCLLFFAWSPASFLVDIFMLLFNMLYFECYCYYCGWACRHMLLGCL